MPQNISFQITYQQSFIVSSLVESKTPTIKDFGVTKGHGGARQEGEEGGQRKIKEEGKN